MSIPLTLTVKEALFVGDGGPADVEVVSAAHHVMKRYPLTCAHSKNTRICEPRCGKTGHSVCAYSVVCTTLWFIRDLL